jgi:peroxidase
VEEMERGRCMLLLMMVLIMDIGRGEGQLVEDFYSFTCPNVEALVKKAVSTKFNQTFTTIPATLRLFFHDCFVTVRYWFSFVPFLTLVVDTLQCTSVVMN